MANIFGGRNSFFNNPFNNGTPRSNRDNGLDLLGFRSALNKARGEGTVSQKTFDELSMQSGDGILADPSAQSKIGALMAILTGEQKGTTKEGRSRLATQKMFDLMKDQPGQRQTLLTPRSNQSRAILGV